MSNIRPMIDPTIATAMVATFQSIESSQSAPAGLSEVRWRILQCIAAAAPNAPTSGELRLRSGLSAAALIGHIQALRGKGLVETGGHQLSPAGAELVGVEHPCQQPETKRVADLTPELIASLRAGMPAREVIPQRKDADLKWAPDRGGEDAWQRSARHSSAMLLAALRRHHPERCGGK